MATDFKDGSTGISNLLAGMFIFYVGADGLYSFLATGKAYYGSRIVLYDSDAAAVFALCIVGGIALIVSGYRILISKDVN